MGMAWSASMETSGPGDGCQQTSTGDGPALRDAGKAHELEGE